MILQPHDRQSLAGNSTSDTVTIEYVTPGGTGVAQVGDVTPSLSARLHIIQTLTMLILHPITPKLDET